MSGATFRVGSATHVGLVRTMNEDSFMVGDGVFAVADGMGGHLAGEVASQMAIHALDAVGAPEHRGSVDAVVAAVVTANDTILQMSRDDPSRRGMGTTLTVLALVPGNGDATTTDELAVVNLGDSRTYRFRAGQLEQITTDHSYVQELVSSGHISADEARNHPQRNIVTRALGIDAGVGVDVWNLPIVEGDRYLLCSDGLVDEVTDERIADVLSNLPDPQSAADHLVDMANRAGGRDNVTVLVVDVAVVDGRVVDGADVPPPPPSVGPPEEATQEIPLVETATDTLPPPVADSQPVAVPEHADANPLQAAATLAEGEAMTSPATKSRRKKFKILLLAALVAGAATIAIVLVVVLRDDGDDPVPTVPPTTVATVPATTSGAVTPTIGGTPGATTAPPTTS